MKDRSNCKRFWEFYKKRFPELTDHEHQKLLKEHMGKSTSH